METLVPTCGGPFTISFLNKTTSTNSFGKTSSPFLSQATTAWLAGFDDDILQHERLKRQKITNKPVPDENID